MTEAELLRVVMWRELLRADSTPAARIAAARVIADMLDTGRTTAQDRLEREIEAYLEERTRRRDGGHVDR